MLFSALSNIYEQIDFGDGKDGGVKRWCKEGCSLPLCIADETRGTKSISVRDDFGGTGRTEMDAHVVSIAPSTSTLDYIVCLAHRITHNARYSHLVLAISCDLCRREHAGFNPDSLIRIVTPLKKIL